MYILEVEQCRAIVSDSMQVLFCTLQNRFENKLTVDVIRCNPDKLENSKKKKKSFFDLQSLYLRASETNHLWLG